MKVYCGNCNYPLYDGITICPSCGNDSIAYAINSEYHRQVLSGEIEQPIERYVPVALEEGVKI